MYLILLLVLGLLLFSLLVANGVFYKKISFSLSFLDGEEVPFLFKIYIRSLILIGFLVAFVDSLYRWGIIDYFYI